MMKNRGLVLGGNSQIVPGELDILKMHQQDIAHIHSCLLLTRNGTHSRVTEVLLQQRGLDKAQYPGHWCFSAAGHCNENDFVRALELGGEADLEGLSRETQEELGIGLEMSSCPAYLPRIKGADGLDQRAEKGKIYRLIDGPFTPHESGVQPFDEHPILTVGWFHLFNGVTVQPGLREIESMSWVPVDRLGDMQLTPWLKYFLRFAPHATSNKIGRQYNYGQIEQRSEIAQSTVGAVF